ncbi:MAG: MaoC/PaaZ C-terminal domain-containing protein [Lachnospiraceae bacterium]|nr:MaoC/PaaZ C-terminal domain-containing protein [Lachnospiraceae bacterium]
MKYEVGQGCYMIRVITENNILNVADASGDCNPIHIDK